MHGDTREATVSPGSDAPTAEQRLGMRHAILAQCFGCLSFLAFSNSLLLVYLTALEIATSRIVTYLSLPALGEALLMLPCAYLADRYGRLRIGIAGTVGETLGFALLTVSGAFRGALAEAWVLAGVLVFAVGRGLFNSSWYALLSPLVPEAMRGQFFGRLRFSWQLCGIVFAGVCAVLLPREAPLWLHQIFIALMTLSLIAKFLFYRRIPELEKVGKIPGGFRRAMGGIVRAEGFPSFCAYVFLLALFTAGCPILFGLIEKKVLALGDNVVVTLGAALMIGSVLGYLVGGQTVDRVGTKPAFLVCHFLYGAVILAFVARAMAPGFLVLFIATLSFLFGLVRAISSIAISAELLALMPAENKALSSSTCLALQTCGGALSGVLAAWALNLGMLSPRWQARGVEMTAYDSVLIACGTMIVLLVVTLGLVPSVLRKERWILPHH